MAPTAARNLAMDSFQYYMHDNPAMFRLQLSGDLSTESVREIEQAWRTACSTLGSRRLIVDITCLRNVNDEGRELLEKWYGHGAALITMSGESKARMQGMVSCPVIHLAGAADCADRLNALAAGSNLSDTCPVSRRFRKPSCMRKSVAGLKALIRRTGHALVAVANLAASRAEAPWIRLGANRNGMERRRGVLPISPKPHGRRS